jgi:hypothetical protein
MLANLTHPFGTNNKHKEHKMKMKTSTYYTVSLTTEEVVAVLSKLIEKKTSNKVTSGTLAADGNTFVFQLQSEETEKEVE